MAANNQALLMLLNQVSSLQNQQLPLQMLNVVQNQKQAVKGKPAMPNAGLNVAGLLASMAGGNTNTRGRCVWAKGLPEDLQNADKLVNIFGNFGNVQRIKFTDKQPDGALIEFDDVRCAVKAVACMNNQKIDGSVINVSFTKIDFAMIKSDDGKSKDVRKAKENWRYAKDGKFRRICMKRLRKLSNKVIVSNLPEGKFDQLKKHIASNGYTVKSIEGSQRPKEDKSSNGYTMAIVELASIGEAIGAVANLHNTWPNKFGEKKTDLRGNVRGLNFSLVGLKEDTGKDSEKAKN